MEPKEDVTAFLKLAFTAALPEYRKEHHQVYTAPEVVQWTTFANTLHAQYRLMSNKKYIPPLILAEKHGCCETTVLPSHIQEVQDSPVGHCNV